MEAGVILIPVVAGFADQPMGRRGRGGDRGLKSMMSVLCCLLPLASAGCGINGAGTTIIETIAAKGATVIRATSYGLHLNTGADDAGASLGMAETLAVYPAARVPATGQSDGWFRLQSPWPDAEPVLLRHRVLGVEIGLNQQRIGAAVGLTERTLLARVSAERSLTRRVLFVPDAPELTELELCEEEQECHGYR